MGKNMRFLARVFLFLGAVALLAAISWLCSFARSFAEYACAAALLVVGVVVAGLGFHFDRKAPSEPLDVEQTARLARFPDH